MNETVLLLTAIISFVITAKSQKSNIDTAGLINYVIDSLILKQHKLEVLGNGQSPYILMDTTWGAGTNNHISEMSSRRFLELLGQLISRDSLQSMIGASGKKDLKKYIGHKKNLVINSQLPYDKLFRRKIHGLFSYVTLTTPVFWREGEFAIMQIEHTYTGTLWLFKYSNNKWSAEKVLSTWMNNVTELGFLNAL